jgi:hypothetical protein
VIVAVLFWAALSHRIYNHTLPRRLIEHVFGEDTDEGGALAVRVLLRKLYSIVAFALMGFVIDKALPHTRRPALRAALIVAAFSAAIEVAQKLHHAREGPLSNAIDIGCGALGGWLAVTVAHALARRRGALPRRGTGLPRR